MYTLMYLLNDGGNVGSLRHYSAETAELYELTANFSFFFSVFLGKISKMRLHVGVKYSRPSQSRDI
jgi:hypothetical protein